MAKDTDVKFTIGGELDEGSVKGSLDQAEKIIDKHPIELNLSIAKRSLKGVEDIQAKLIDKIEKVSGKYGDLLSAPKKEINQINTLFNKLTKQTNAKQQSSKAYQEIAKAIEEPLKIYNEQRKALRAEQKALLNEAKKTVAKTKKARYFGKHSREEIDSNIRQEEKRRKLYGIKTAGPKGFKRDVSFDNGIATEDTLKASDRSPYRSNYARQMRLSEMASAKWMKASLRAYNNTALANQMADDAIKKGGNKRKLTEGQKATEKVDTASKQLAKILSRLESAKPDALIKDFEDYANATLKFGETSDRGVYGATLSMLDKVFDRYFNTRGAIGIGDGEPTGVGPGHADAQTAILGMINKFKEIYTKGIANKAIKVGDKLINVSAETIRQLQVLKNLNKDEAIKEIDKILKGTSTINVREARKGNNLLAREVRKVNENVNEQNDLTKASSTLDKVEAAREGTMDENLESIEETDAENGFNSGEESAELIDEVRKLNKDNENIIAPENIQKILQEGLPQSSLGKCPCEDILKAISDNVKLIANSMGITPPSQTKRTVKGSRPIDNHPMGPLQQSLTVIKDSMQKALIPISDVIDKTEKIATTKFREDKTDHEKLSYERSAWEKVQKEQREKQGERKTLSSEDLYFGHRDSKLVIALKKAFGIKNTGPNAQNMLTMTQDEQKKILAERISMFGLSNQEGRIGATGAKAQASYRKALYGWDKKSQVDPFETLRLTDSIKFDSQAITDSLQRLIEKNMFNAQTGGVWANLRGMFTLYAGQPSLEKSRAQADAINSIMANIREAALTLLQAIQNKELTLQGLQDKGQATFDRDGRLISGTAEAQKLFVDVENLKSSLHGVLAEAVMVDDVAESCGNKVTTILKRLGFAAPELQKNNIILQNINAGLDKNGKALKYQTRFSEILNYSFQLIARHIGQMIKGWLLMLNPINLIKKAFQDFASYDVKWQRTMNVIKYNLRRIIRPAMEWIAQQLVNIIGLGNALVKGIGKAFGQDWDLFDRQAAAAEQMREELEAAANVTAGFDELHDIGGESSGNAAMDLLSGDIYTPQWDGLYKVLENIGEVIGKIIDAVSNWSFWDWLKLIGAALLGFLALKWLIGLFTGRNPLEAVAKGFSFLEKAVGWALLILAFAEFTKALKDFIDVVGHMKPEEVQQALTALALGIGILVIAAGGLMVISKALNMAAPAILGLAAMVGAFALVIGALGLFIDTVKDMSSEQLLTSLGALAASLAIVAGIIVVMLVALSAIISTGVGAIAVAALAAITAAVALVILSLSAFVLALEHSKDGVKIFFDGIVAVIQTVGNVITQIFSTIGNFVLGYITTIGNFIVDLVDKIVTLASVIAHEIGETIRSVFETTGEVVIGILNEVTDIIPNLLRAIVNFCNDIGPAVENSADAIMRTVTKVINFMISGVEYLVNLFVSGVNNIISGVNSVSKYVGFTIPLVAKVEIPRFVPQYETGTNYVPNDGLAYLHQGEAVIPKKYNQPYSQGMSNEERTYMQQMMNTMKSLDSTMKQGININGQFVQRGSDLVAVVNKTKSQTGADLLSNVSYAR